MRTRELRGLTPVALLSRLVELEARVAELEKPRPVKKAAPAAEK